jgi:iron complex outermembrane receptor protein
MVNTALKPEKGTLLEIGSKGSLRHKRLSYQLAIFSMNIYDKLTTQAVADTIGTVLYTFTTNAGKQENKGLELDIAYVLRQDKNKLISFVQPFAAFTYADFKYKNFKSDNNNNALTIDYTGNQVSGVAAVMWNAGWDMELKYDIYFHATYQYVAQMPITYDNQHHAPAYSLLNAKLGYKKTIGKHLFLNIYAGGNNLTSRLYYQMVFLNANFSGTPPALYLPAAYTATFYGGLNLSYQLTIDN